VSMLFMIAAAYNQHSYYLKTLSYFSAKLKKKELRDTLMAAQTPRDVYDLLIQC
jgi:nitrogen PTS system EIIA component